MKFNEKNILEHPILSFLALVLSIIIITLGTTTFATMGYVDKKHKEAKGYIKEKTKSITDDVNEKHKDIKDDISEIKSAIKDVNNNILKLYKGK